jgi:hypothetical protein
MASLNATLLQATMTPSLGAHDVFSVSSDNVADIVRPPAASAMGRQWSSSPSLFRQYPVLEPRAVFSWSTELVICSLSRAGGTVWPN